MKKLLFFIFTLFTAASSNAQTAQDFFKTSTITWLGVDYSHVKLIGDFSQFAGAGEKGSTQIKNQYFPAWNGLVLNEPDKYNLKDAFKKTEIIYDVDMVNGINSETNADSLETYKVPNYSKEQLTSFVNAYPIKEGKGFGVVFIAEVLSKVAVEGIFHVVVLNLETKEVLFIEQVRGAPGGIGLRNYWAGSLASALKSIDRTLYKSWKTKYASKK